MVTLFPDFPDLELATLPYEPYELERRKMDLGFSVGTDGAGDFIGSVRALGGDGLLATFSGSVEAAGMGLGGGWGSG
jgi:hypothetical protein